MQEDINYPSLIVCTDGVIISTTSVDLIFSLEMWNAMHRYVADALSGVNDGKSALIKDLPELVWDDTLPDA